MTTPTLGGGPSDNGSFDRKTFLFDIIGLDLNNPIDRLRDGYARILQNLRPDADNSLSPRPGTGNGLQVVAGQSPAHSIRRLNDSSSGLLVSKMVVGTGTHLATTDTATPLGSAADKSSGWSGDPLSMVVHQPNESAKPYCYAFDRLKMQKIDASGNLKQVGLPAPTALPTAALTQPLYNGIDAMDSIVAPVWAAGGTAAALGTATRINPATTSITAILYDTAPALTGWACVRPSSMLNIGKDAWIGCTGGNPESFVVQETFQGAPETTIAGIRYESGGSPGLCWIYLGIPYEQLEPDAMVLLDRTGVAEYVRVLAVERTPDGLVAFRCSTVNAFVGGELALIVPSFRAYFTLTHAAADPLTATVLSFSVATGTGWISRNIGAAAALDLSQIATGVPTRPDDRLHLSVQVDRPDLVTEIKILGDIDSATTNAPAAGDFTQNYFLKVLRQNDFTPVTTGTQTALGNQQTRYQRDLLGRGPDDPRRPFNRTEDPGGSGTGVANPPPADPPPTDSVTPPGGHSGSGSGSGSDTGSTQTSAGRNQYAEVVFRVGEWTALDIGRVGSDLSRGLANIAALRILVVATGAVVVKVDGFWLGGGFGPDVSTARPRIYRYRYRDSSTGVASNWSPALRGGVRPYRQKVNVSVTGLNLGTNPEADKIDVAVLGGPALGWRYLGSVQSPGASVAQLADTFSDADLSGRDTLTDGNVHYQPWAVIGAPVTTAGGYTGSGTGTLFTTITGAIDLNTAPGTALKIGGKDFTLYRVLSASRIELVESVGAVTAVTWEIPAPLLANQRLPIVVGPFKNFFFAMGDALNPQRLYYSNGNELDTTRDDHWIDVESEILQNGVVLEDGRLIVFSVTGAFSIEPAFTLSETGGGLFTWRRLPVDRGLPFRYAICRHGAGIAWLGSDGIYLTDGSGSTCLTDDLRVLFPREGTSTNPALWLGGVSMTTADANNLRLSYAQGELFFDYLDLNGARLTLVRRVNGRGQGGWRSYRYATGSEARLHYEEEGPGAYGVVMCGSNGKIYRLARGVADEGGASIVAQVLVRAEDFGDAAVSKYLGDVLIDYDTDGATVSVSPGTDNYTANLFTANLTDAAGRRQKRIDFNSGQGFRGRNIAALVSMTVTTQRPLLYLYQFSWQPEPETTLLRANEYNLVGGGGEKCVRGIWIWANTYGVDRAALFEYTKYDGTVANLPFSNINHSQLTERFYPVPVGIYLAASRVRPTDANQWDFRGYRLEGEDAPPNSTEPDPWTDFGEARYVQGVRYEIDTNNAPCNMTIQLDEFTVQTTIDATHNSGPVTANGRAIKAFSFETPFITHLIRSLPSSLRRLWRAEYISEPEPEQVYMWHAQQTDCGEPGYKIFGDGEVTVRSTDELILEFEIDGTVVTAVWYPASTNSASARRCYRFRLPACKGKIIRPRLYAANANKLGRVAVFHKEFSLQFKPWGAETAWRSAALMGDAHYQSGARI